MNEELAVSSIANLPPDMAILKLENETIQSLAAARPRNYEQIKSDLVAQIDAYPSFARDCIYSKPVGKDASGRQQYARGLSIRAAEAIAEAYGYNRVRADVTPIDADRVKVEASFTDYQKGRIWQDSGIVSRVYKRSGGGMGRHEDDRFYNVVIKAEKSKYVREVILRSVPPGLRSELMEMAERRIDDLLDDKTVEKIIGQFASKQVTLEMLEEHVGRTLKAGWTQDDRKNLLGVWAGVKSGEMTVAEVFGAEEAKNGGGKTEEVAGKLVKKAGGKNGETPKETPKEAPKTDAAKPPAEGDKQAEESDLFKQTRLLIYDEIGERNLSHDAVKELCKEVGATGGVATLKTVEQAAKVLDGVRALQPAGAK